MNFRRHPDHQRDALRSLLDSTGVVSPLLVMEDGDGYMLLDGELRWSEGGEWPVAILDIDESEAATVLAMLDKIGADAEIDPDALIALLDSLPSEARQTAGAAWSDDELAALIGSAVADEPEEDAPVSVDETKPTRCQPGDVWRIGRHTVACVDSTDRAIVEGLIAGRTVGMIVADPPYGIDIVGGDYYVGGGEQYKIPFGGFKKGGHGAFRGEGRTKDNAPTRRYLPVIGDHEPDTAVNASALCLELFSDATQVWWGANNYSNALPPSRCWIVWDKENTGDFADAELAWCSSDSVVRIFRHMWNGMLKDSERGERRTHPTQKPIALFAWMYETYGSTADLIFDPFLGSGPSLKAAEPLGRTVIGCELSPAYIDHLLEWGESRGLTVERATP